jgi:hypothetical protein
MSSAFADRVASSIVPLGGFLRCTVCGRDEPLDHVGHHLDTGWPRCCGYTMRWWTQRQIDAGEVQR